MTRHAATTALVTGATQGLGLAIAERLIAEGCRKVAIVGRDVARGEAAAQSLAAEGVEAVFLPGDMGDAGRARSVVEEAAERFGGLTAFVSAAAVTDRASILDCPPEEFDRMMATNARGPFLALQRFAQLAIEAGRPAAAVNILSVVVHGGQSFLAPYSASKAALANITKNAASALRHHHIRVNGVNVGWMDTPGEDAIQRRWHGAEDGWLEKVEARMPFGKLVKPDNVAALVAYLLSDDAGVMTGSLIDFDQQVIGVYPE